MNIIRWLQGERRGLSAGNERPTRKQKVISYFAPSILIPILIRLADVSFYQETIDFIKMRAAGISGVIIRAGQRFWPDIMFVVNWTLAKLTGLPRGSYWLYDDREPPIKQAALWWSLIKDDVGELFHAADIEIVYGGAYGTKAHYKEFIIEFQRLSGLPDDRIVIYSGFYWWNEHVGNDAFFKRYKLWLAWYSSMEVVRVPLPWLDESNLIAWQDTSHGLVDGVKGNVDLNFFNGDEEKYNQYAGGTPPPIGEPMRYRVVGANGLNLRNAPFSGSVLVLVPMGAYVFGSVDPVSGWLHGNAYQETGQAEVPLDFWCSALPGYIVEDAAPPPANDVVFEPFDLPYRLNGVSKTQRYNPE